MSDPTPTMRTHLRTVEAALAARFEAATVDALLAPVRAAMAQPADARDAEELIEAFERIGDVLELCRLVLTREAA